jgi:hypothetical protein
MELIRRITRNDEKMPHQVLFCSIMPASCGKSLDHFAYRKRSKKRKVKSSLTLGSYMILSGNSVNPDRQFTPAPV